MSWRQVLLKREIGASKDLLSCWQHEILKDLLVNFGIDFRKQTITDWGNLTLDWVQPGWFSSPGNRHTRFFRMWHKSFFHPWRALLSSEPPSSSSFLLTRRDVSVSASDGSSEGAWSLECGCGNPSPAVGGGLLLLKRWHHGPDIPWKSKLNCWSG